jgi:hypothetical protein
MLRRGTVQWKYRSDLFDLETDFDGKTTRCESSGNLQKPLASGDISINITGV